MASDEFSELNRTISEVTLTEEGVFHKDQVPDDVEGSGQLDVEVVHAVQLVNSKGEIFVMHFDVPAAQNDSRSETDYTNKQTRESSSSNTMQAGKLDDDKIAKGASMKSLLNVGENL